MEEKDKTEKIYIPMSLVVSLTLVGGAFAYTEMSRVPAGTNPIGAQSVSVDDLVERVLSSEGIVLPIVWGDLGMRLMESGVIDRERFEAVYAGRGGMSNEEKELLYGENTGNLKMTPENADFILNLLWGFGLGNKNEVLEKGPMMDPRYGGADGFASTGGWTIARGNAMDHYSAYTFVALTPEQQARVVRVSKNIYRPCCGNSTYFPDCNHGMAMLGLVELMAAQGISEEEMYKIALQVNSYWFPNTYVTIAKYFDQKGIEWNTVSPKEVLGANFSSATGYRRVLAEVEPVQSQSGQGCGI